jgi:hypothetical protein
VAWVSKVAHTGGAPGTALLSALDEVLRDTSDRRSARRLF